MTILKHQSTHVVLDTPNNRDIYARQAHLTVDKVWGIQMLNTTVADSVLEVSRIAYRLFGNPIANDVRFMGSWRRGSVLVTRWAHHSFKNNKHVTVVHQVCDV
jgi:hypothetical protein